MLIGDTAAANTYPYISVSHITTCLPSSMRAQRATQPCSPAGRRGVIESHRRLTIS